MPIAAQRVVDHAPQLAGDGRGLVLLRDDEDLLADGGLLLEPGLEVGFGLVGSGGVEGADPLTVSVAEQAADAASLARCRCRAGRFAMPVLPRGRLGRVAGKAGAASWAPAPGVRLAAEAATNAPAWRNVRRSVGDRSSCAIVIASSANGTARSSREYGIRRSIDPTAQGAWNQSRVASAAISGPGQPVFLVLGSPARGRAGQT